MADTLATQQAQTERSRRNWILTGLAVSAWGAWFHNNLEFPDMPFLAPEMLSIFVPSVALAVWWLIQPGRIVWWATLAWVALNLLVGAVLSVLPLSMWPFAPEQSIAHYLNHLLYGVTQVPVLYALWLERSETDPA